jgi:fructokinase
MTRIVCFGEVLWDVFPTQKKIGGAPLNVALRLHSFQNDVTIISSVGDDENGKELLRFIEEQGVYTGNIQINKNYETSKVAVILDQKGAASYTITHPCAWDFIEINKRLLSLVKVSDAFIFGSLVSRNKQSETTLKKLLTLSSFAVFDVNLRPPHYTIAVLTNLMKAAHFIKFNDDELLEICTSLGVTLKTIEDQLQFIASHTTTQNICVTKGSKGAVLFYEGTFFYNDGYVVKVADTVGSGDSFLATLIDALLKKVAPQKAIDTACAVGALVAKNKGANPVISEQDIEAILIE